MIPKEDKTTRTRVQYSADEKVRLLRHHLVEGQPISAICDAHQIHPTLFYQWQKTFFENGAAAFDRSPRSQRTELGSQRIVQLYQHDTGGGADFPCYKTVDFTLTAPDGRKGHYRIEVCADSETKAAQWIRKVNW